MIKSMAFLPGYRQNVKSGDYFGKVVSHRIPIQGIAGGRSS
jgi:hypothetical protein